MLTAMAAITVVILILVALAPVSLEERDPLDEVMRRYRREQIRKIMKRERP